MKVLWVIRGSEIYGEKRAIRSLMSGVRAAGWATEALSLTHGECSADLEADGLSLTYLNLGESPGFHLASGRMGKAWPAILLTRRQFALAPTLLRTIEDKQPDIVHVLDKNILPVVGWATKRLDLPCFWEMTSNLGSGYPFHYNRRLHRLLVRMFGLHPLANSLYTAASLEGPGCPVDTMYLGTDGRLFDPGRHFSVTRASLGIPTDADVFTIVARMEPSKGQRLFLESFVQACSSSASADRPHLLLIGAHPGNAEVRAIQAIIPPAWKSRVHFIDLTNQPEAYLALSDVVVNARIDAEPFGFSTVEGMMMGKPLLVHALGGPAETVIDGQTGWHVHEATVEGFAAGIRRAMAERSRWKEMGARARARACEFYSLDVQTRRYQELVRRHLHRPLP